MVAAAHLRAPGRWLDNARMGTLRSRFEAYWDGTLDPDENPPIFPSFEEEEVADGTFFISAFANVSVLRTDAGLVLVDAGGPALGNRVLSAVRGWSRDPVHAAIYTHGHVDHVVGIARFEEEQRAAGLPPFTVIAHEAVADRFARYALSAGYNACANTRQFQIGVEWPTVFRQPDRTYRDSLKEDFGGVPFELHHARGETDDATWVWLPTRRVLCAGDLFIWATPNAGNPQKAQRYALDWARALRAMAKLGAEVLLPGHGIPVYGAARVERALAETAALLEHLHDETLLRMNAGQSLDEILQEVKAPAALLDRPYLRPLYDEPEFIVRNVWRLYGGWWDGDPAALQPAPRGDLAKEFCALAGGASVIASRARELADRKEFALACHLIDAACRGAPEDRGIAELRSSIYAGRANAAVSLMARGIYSDAARREGVR